VKGRCAVKIPVQACQNSNDLEEWCEIIRIQSNITMSNVKLHWFNFSQRLIMTFFLFFRIHMMLYWNLAITTSKYWWMSQGKEYGKIQFFLKFYPSNQ